MNVRNLSSLLLSLLTLVVLGCGGGGGGGEAGLPKLVSTVSGEAQKGPIIGGDVKIYAIDADGTLQSTPLQTTPAIVTTREPFGNYSAVISYEGPVKVVVTGNEGSIYKDEATGTNVPFAGQSLSAVVASVTGSAKVAVTPFTELAAKKAGTTTLTPANIKAANTSVAIALGLQDVDIVAATPSTNPKYKFNLAAISKTAGADAAAVSTLLTQMASAIDIDSGSITDSDLRTRFDKGKVDAFNDLKINPTGTITGIDPSAVSAVTLTVSPSPNAEINSTVTLSASVKTILGGPVANGTVVTFTASAGTVALVTTTSNGIATATLSGISSPQTVSVTASAGNIKSSEINFNFINSSSQSVITVADTAGDHFKGIPVTITANIKTKGGTVAPVGTTVNFEITSGTGTLSQASTTTDASGNASVTLNSTVDGNVTVKITSSLATGSHTITFTNPDKPGSISLIANRSSGVTNNLGPVILTATLTPENIVTGTIADGTPVTFTILSGTGGTLSSTTANTAGGVASVTLNSSAVGNFSINAKAGSTPLVTSNAVNVPFVNPTKVTVTVRTTGTLLAGTTIGGLKATVSASPSAGLTIASDPNGNSSDASATGAGVGSTLITNSNNVAAVTLALVNTGGIQTGEFATLNYHVAAGSFPTANDFSIALSGSVIDTLSANISGIGVAIQSVTFQ